VPPRGAAAPKGAARTRQGTSRAAPVCALRLLSSAFVTQYYGRAASSACRSVARNRGDRRYNRR
jgi:hypothetical protein